MFYFDIASMVSNILPWVFIVGTIVGLYMYISGKMHIDGNGDNGQKTQQASKQQAQRPTQTQQQAQPQQQQQQPPQNGGI